MGNEKTARSLNVQCEASPPIVHLAAIIGRVLPEATSFVVF